MNIDVEQVASTLKLDTEKVFEALPAIATIIEKSELIDYAQELGEMNSANGFKLMVRVVSKMKEYQEEIDDVLSIMFNVKASEMTNAEKMKLLTKILTEKDLNDFF